MTETRTQLPDDPFGVLRRVLAPRSRPRPGEACDMCGESIASDQHSHVASISDRRLLCTCRACYLLFTREGAGRRRLRAVPDRPRRQRQFAFTQAQWDELAIPVELVFLLQQSDPVDVAGPASLVACYPSPAGATESELDLSAWTALTADNPVLADVEPDVEAVLIRRNGSENFTGLVVPIDACYELVGIVRQHWAGFQGGAEVWARIDDFFGGLIERAGG
jgi:Family of unknown function (DUF5947)